MDSREHILLDVALTSLGTPDSDAVLRTVVDAARGLTGARFGGFAVLDRRASPGVEGVGIARFVSSGIDPHTIERLPQPRGKGVLGLLISDPEPLRLSDIGAHPQSYGFPSGHPPMSTLLGVPVTVAGRQFGNLYLSEKSDGEEFTERDQQEVIELAAIAGAALETAQRYEALEHRCEQLEQAVGALDATIQIARAIGDETELEPILELVAKRGRALVAARAFLIELVADDELVVTAAAGEVSHELLGSRIPLAGTVAEEALELEAAVRVESEPMRRRFTEVGIGRLGIQTEAALVVPLVFRGRPLGALLAIDRLSNGPSFSTEDERLLKAFAASAATAVATAHSVSADIERLASVVRFSPDAIVTTDVDGLITSWNPGAEQIYGYTANEVIGQSGSVLASMVVPEQRRNEDVDVLARVLRGEVVSARQTERVRKNGARVEISLSVAAIKDRYGRIIGCATIARELPGADLHGAHS